MNWEAIGAVGEIVGALAVLLTLGYLAIQIRQNTKSVRAAALDSGITAVNAIRQAVIQSAEVAAIYRNGSKDPDTLTEIDRERYRLLINNMLWSMWNIYSQTNYASLSASTWEAQLPVISRLMNSPGGRWFWSLYHMEFEAGYRLEIEKLIDSGVRDEHGPADA